MSCLVQGVGILCLAAAPNLPVALAGAAIAGGGSALVFPALALLVVGRTPDDQRGAAIGAFTACFDLGFAVGGVTLGVVADAAGYGAAFTVAAAACAVGALRRPARRARPGVGRAPAVLGAARVGGVTVRATRRPAVAAVRRVTRPARVQRGDVRAVRHVT